MAGAGGKDGDGVTHAVVPQQAGPDDDRARRSGDGLTGDLVFITEFVNRVEAALSKETGKRV
jgi:hypothetical protein